MASSQPLSSIERRRGRPSPTRAAAIEQDIRKAALGIFAAAGFEAASMDAIAAAAKVSKGTLYARYQSKEALFRSVLEHELEQLSDRAGAADHLLPGDLEGRLRQHARRLMEVLEWSDYARIERLVASATPSLPDIGRLWHETSFRRYVAYLARDMAGTGHLAASAPVTWDHLAQVFIQTIAGWHLVETAIQPPGEDEIIRFSEAVIAVIMAAVRQYSDLPHDSNPGKAQ